MSGARFAGTDAMSIFLDGVLERRVDSREYRVATGHEELDAVLAGGLRAGTVSVVAGIPGVGTSMFCLGIVRHAALVDGLCSLVIAPDATETEIFTRILSAEAKIPINHLRSGVATPDDLVKAQRRKSALVDAPLLVSANWQRQATTEAVLASIEEPLPQGVRVVFVDGTHQSEPCARDLVRGLKSLAQRTQAAILVASKVVMPDHRRGDWPCVEDLREYRSTADLFDLILSLHRPDLHDPECTRPGEADVDILKHRYGPTRRLTLAFQGHYARFVDMTS